MIFYIQSTKVKLNGSKLLRRLRAKSGTSVMNDEAFASAFNQQIIVLPPYDDAVHTYIGKGRPA